MASHTDGIPYSAAAGRTRMSEEIMRSFSRDSTLRHALPQLSPPTTPSLPYPTQSFASLRNLPPSSPNQSVERQIEGIRTIIFKK